MPSLAHTRVLHIDITGHDAPGVTHALTTILGRFDARILDIGQAVIHDALALGLLVELTDAMKSSSLMTELLLKAHALGVRIHFRAITADEYDAWVRAQTKQRFLVSLLGPTLDAAPLAAASGLLSRKVGGPSVRPPQPAGISELTYANSAKWVESKGEDRHHGEG